MRERFNEARARRTAAQLPEKFLATFMAMTPALRGECIARFNRFMAESPAYMPRFEIRRIGGQEQST